DVVTGAIEEAAAANTNLADDGGQARDCVRRLAAVAVALHAIGELEQRGLGRTIAPGQGFNHLNGDTSESADARGGILRNALAQLPPADGVGGEPRFIG